MLGFGGFAFSEFYTAWKEQKHEQRERYKKEKLPQTSSTVSNNSHESSPLLLSGESDNKWTWRKIVSKHLI